MNKDEKIASNYLETLGLGIPKFEPDGNCPPDFAFECAIGIEVRRLNQNYFQGSEVEGMEQVAIRVQQALENCFHSFKSDGKSYFVALDYKRPISERTKILKKDITNTLNRFLIKKKFFPEKYSVNKNISLQFIEATKTYKNKFLLGINHDFDTGGWLIELLVENTSYCVIEKSEKIKKYKSNYKEWWLLLVDHIGISMMASEDYSELKQYSLEKGSFNKVLIIDPNTLKEIFFY